MDGLNHTCHFREVFVTAYNFVAPKHIMEAA